MAPASLTLSPAIVVGGATSQATLTLSGPAPEGGAAVALSSSDPALATVPASVTVPGGATSAGFTVTSLPVQWATGVSIAATYGGVMQVARLIVTEAPPNGNQLTSLTVAPEVVVGGTPAQGTVTLAAAATSDVAVTLGSTDPSVATVPASVTVRSGSSSATFTITTLAVAGSGWALITVEAGGVTRSASITTTAAPTGPAVVSVAFFPARVGGGGPVTGRVTLSGPATDGARVLLESGNPAVQLPDEVVVSRNQRSADFPVTTSPVAAETPVTVTATACCGAVGERSGTLTVATDAPPPPDVVRIESAVFKPGGRGGTLTVRATSTSANAILSAFRGAATTPAMVLANKGGGRYEGSVSFSGPRPQTVTVRSNLGGSATAAVR
jgi:hypothetical protein